MDKKYYKKYIKYKSKYIELRGGANIVRIGELQYVFKTEEIVPNIKQFIYSTSNSCIKKIIISIINTNINTVKIIVTYDGIVITDTEFNNFITEYKDSYKKFIFKITDEINYDSNNRNIDIIVIYTMAHNKKYRSANINTNITTDKQKNTHISNTEPPHQVPIFKELMRIYLGIMPQIISASEGSHDGTITHGQDKKITTTYNNFSNEYIKIYIEPIELDYIDSNTYFCFTPGCSNTDKHGVHIFRLNNRLVIAFSTGKTRSNDDSLIIKDQKQNFYKWIQYIINLIGVHKIDNILLCGHSNGMSSATIITFLLLYLQELLKLHNNQANKIDGFKDIFNKYFFNKFFDKDAEQLDIFNNLSDIAKKYKQSRIINTQLYLVGTAGFPVIFDTWDQYNFFYELLKKNYLHIGLCNDKNQIDGFMQPIIVKNWKFFIYKKSTLCYYGKNTEDIKFLDLEVPNDALDKWIERQSEYQNMLKEYPATLFTPSDIIYIFKKKYKLQVAAYQTILDKEKVNAHNLHMFESYRNVLLPFFL
jgi:hypothetical protein